MRKGSRPEPPEIRDEVFRSGGFFDASDVAQVKYEMLRRHRVDGLGVKEVAALFGVSRQTFFRAERAFDALGLAGLVPATPGPRAGHKCTQEILAFVEQRRRERPRVTLAALLDPIEARFGVSINEGALRAALERRRRARAASARRAKRAAAPRRPRAS